MDDKKAVKIVLIGAGSAVFTQGLVADMIQSGDSFRLGLVDINPEALETAAGLARRMVESRSAPIDISASTDRREVMPGADAVVTTIGVGGRRAWERDVFIPRKYGIFQPVGDTVMPGGISRALRQIPPMIDIAADLAELCPEAFFFNYSNPMSANCRAVRKASGVKLIGLCHGVIHTLRHLALFAGADPDAVTGRAAGLNHLTWVYELRDSGGDLWPQMKNKLASERRQPTMSDPLGRMPWAEGKPVDSGPPSAVDDPFSWSLFDNYGLFPAPLDRHTVEFYPEHHPGGKYYGRTLGVDAFSFETTIAHGDRVYKSMSDQARGVSELDQTLFQRGAGEHEQLLDIMASIASDRPEIFSVNLPNDGAVAGLPDYAVLEIPAAATGNGFQSETVPPLPAEITKHLAAKIQTVEITVEAALTGDQKLVVEAMLADGAVTDKNIAEKLTAELLDAQAEHLPQFG
ncbi:hypothetical protein ACFLT7_04545 [candidate division KSB1 bacterium]